MKATVDTTMFLLSAELFARWAQDAKDREDWELANLYATTAVNYWRRVKWL